MKNLYKIEDELYIISNTENVDENCWIITDGKLVQVSYLLSDEVAKGNKIILTTNKLLIKDGVQAIDDEFLQWFVKNSSCNYVETKLFHDSEDHPELVGNIKEEWSYYKIIIPKKEVFEMYSHLYGKTVTMNDRFETKHIWSEELALINKGKWIPQEEPKQLIKMKKQIRRFKVDFDFNWTYGVEIKKLREDLDKLEKLGVTEIEIEAEENWGSASVTIKAFTEREETDEEYQKRINKEIQRQEEIKRRELQQLELLKSKYGM